MLQLQLFNEKKPQLPDRIGGTPGVLPELITEMVIEKRYDQKDKKEPRLMMSYNNFFRDRVFITNVQKNRVRKSWFLTTFMKMSLKIIIIFE